MSDNRNVAHRLNNYQHQVNTDLRKNEKFQKISAKGQYLPPTMLKGGCTPSIRE